MTRPRVAVVGGGLAGLAAAVALVDEPCDVHVFESRRQLGGRATSFRDPATGAVVDFCQHVSMGCCTNLADLCRRTGIADQFRRERVLHFIGPDGNETKFSAARWLPAPLHLGPALMRLAYLTLGERISAARTLLKLARTKFSSADEPTIGAWLIAQKQSSNAIERFWSVVLESALGEKVAKASFSAARKVFVDGFMSNRQGYEVLIPELPLSELFSERIGKWLQDAGMTVQTGAAIERIDRDADGKLKLIASGGVDSFDCVIVAVPWRQIESLVAPELHPALPWLKSLAQFESSPITGIHLWFDRPITALPHAVLVGWLSQWMFNRGSQPDAGGATRHYYQIVVSASRDLAGRDRDDIAQQVCNELRQVWPASREANLVTSKVVTEQHAVFSVRPGLDELRPPQQTAVPGLFIAGDWTATGWPATMEGAVRSGYLAAEALLQSIGAGKTIVQPDLPRTGLARLHF